MSEKIRWGILGTGHIAGKFATGLQALPDAVITAVGSRAQHTADKFGAEFNIGPAHWHSSYEALANDPDVDVVYVATPHTYHKENTLLCLNAGKAVLCEKPFTINAREADEVIRCAREKKLLLVEAMWTRFTPAMMKIWQMIGEQAIGDVWMLAADFGFRTTFNPGSRLFAPELGGGALLDVGIYPLSLASMLFGQPLRIQAMAYLGQTGVDEQTGIQFGYPDGQLATITCAMRTRTPMEAVIAGTEGYIHIAAPWWKTQKFTLSIPDKGDQVYEMPFKGNGYNYEAAEVMRCLRGGFTETPIMPLDETLAIMRTVDQVRLQIGLRYPGEEAV